MPAPIRDSHGAASRSTGSGKGYRYPHDFGGWVEQQYLPDEIVDRRYFEPIAGRELELSRRLDELKADETRPDNPGRSSKG